MIISVIGSSNPATREHVEMAEEVGREFGVTRERIRQIEAKVLQKMKEHPEAEKIKGF